MQKQSNLFQDILLLPKDFFDDYFSSAASLGGFLVSDEHSSVLSYTNDQGNKIILS